MEFSLIALKEILKEIQSKILIKIKEMSKTLFRLLTLVILMWLMHRNIKIRMMKTKILIMNMLEK